MFKRSRMLLATRLTWIVNGASRYANAGICSVWVLILKLAKLSCYHCSECCLLVKQWWHSWAVNLPPKSDSLCIPSSWYCVPPLNLLVVQTNQLCSHTPPWIILLNLSPCFPFFFSLFLLHIYIYIHCILKTNKQKRNIPQEQRGGEK